MAFICPPCHEIGGNDQHIATLSIGPCEHCGKTVACYECSDYQFAQDPDPEPDTSGLDPSMPSLTRPAPEDPSPEARLRQAIIDKGRSLAEAEKKLEDAVGKLRIAQTAKDEAERDVRARRANWNDAVSAYHVHQWGTT